ncbi:MAG TPA: DinB family protein [Gammaproteobacteria bacterium]|nr:DinB family protein [Gammaproteobacteria bacterium]
MNLETVKTLAAYNRWMNERLYECCARLPDAARKQDMGAFFKSIHGTLNHLLLSDRVWLGRFTGKAFAVSSLAQELYADFDQLRAERAVTDALISAWIASLNAKDLARDLVYTTIVNPQQRRTPLWFTLSHLFNHQTHHRGQLTTLLFQQGIDPGVTDLLALPPDRGGLL